MGQSERRMRNQGTSVGLQDGCMLFDQVVCNKHGSLLRFLLCVLSSFLLECTLAPNSTVLPLPLVLCMPRVDVNDAVEKLYDRPVTMIPCKVRSSLLEGVGGKFVSTNVPWFRKR
jgi:hypothetical protein